MYKTIITFITAWRLGRPYRQIKQWIEFDFTNDGEPCPSVGDLIDHIEYQESVCMSDNPTESFFYNY